MIRNLTFALFVAVAVIPARVDATSAFARQYGFSCNRCHSVIPLLNNFGENFKSNGYRVAGMRAAQTIPVSMSMMASYQNGNSRSKPKATLDEWRLQSGGALGPSETYYLEQYLIDGGGPGSLDQAWVQLDSNTAHPIAKIDLRLRGGRIYFPLPVYADTYRPTLNPYAVFEQAVGANGFTMDGVHTAVELTASDGYNGASLNLVDFSGNIALFATQPVGKVSLSSYRVMGKATIGTANDFFWRQGVAAVVPSGPFSYRILLQRGCDTNADGFGLSNFSSGGFAEVQYVLNNNLLAAARLDGTSLGGSITRSIVTSLSFGLTTDSRLTVEDVLQHGKPSFRESFLVAF